MSARYMTILWRSFLKNQLILTLSEFSQNEYEELEILGRMIEDANDLISGKYIEVSYGYDILNETIPCPLMERELEIYRDASVRGCLVKGKSGDYKENEFLCELPEGAKLIASSVEDVFAILLNDSEKLEFSA